MKSGTYGSAAEKYQDQRKLESLINIQKGGINAGSSVADGLGSMRLLGAFFEKQGIQTFDQMRDARNNTEQVKLMSSITGMSENEVRDVLEAASAQMESTNQTYAQVLDKNMKGLVEKVGQVTAEREAIDFASNTVTAISGASEIGNALLYRISELMQKLYNAFVDLGAALSKLVPKLPSWLGGEKDTGKLIDQDKYKEKVAEAVPQAKGAKALLSGVTAAQGSADLIKLMDKRNEKLLGTGMNSRIVAPAVSKVASTATTAPIGVSGGGSTAYPAGVDVSTPAGAAAGNMPQINMSAILQLPDNKPIELIVKKVLYDREQRR